MRSFKKPFLFLAIIIIFAGLAYWDDWKTKNDIEKAKTKDQLVDFTAASIEEITYQKHNEQGASFDLTLAKKDGKWRIIRPESYAADSGAVERLLKVIEDAQFEKSFVADAKRLNDFGLSPPQIIIGLKTKDGIGERISLGGKSPTGFSVYAQLSSNPRMLLLNQYVFTAANKEMQDFRDRSLGIPDGVEVKGFTFHRASQAPITFARRERDWFIVSDGDQKADPQEVNGFLSFLQQLKAERFIDQPSPDLEKALTQDNPGSQLVAKLQFETVHGLSQSFTLIENNGVIYTQIPGQKGTVALDKKVEQGLKKSLKEFVYRGMFSFNSTEATQVTLDGAVFEKKENQWKLAGSSKNADYIRLLLVDLEFAKAEEILKSDTMKEVVKEQPTHRLLLQFKDSSKLEIALWINKNRPDTIYLKRGQDGFFLAPATIMDNFKEQPAAADDQNKWQG